MFGKKNEENETIPEAVVPQDRKGYTPKKGTATPSRKQATAARRRPIVADRTSMTKEQRKELKNQQRDARNRQWNLEQAAMKSGDERHMPAQHAGPVRRFGRDFIDSRFTPGASFMPLAVILLVLMFFQSRFPQVFIILTFAVYGFILLTGIWTGFLVHNARLAATHKFGADRVPRGFSSQLFSRSFYPRRFRLPRPMVSHGEYPAGGAPADMKEARKSYKAK